MAYDVSAGLRVTSANISPISIICASVVKRVLKGLTQPETEDEKNQRPFTQEEAAQFLRKSQQTLTAWRKAGNIKAYELGGRVYLNFFH